MRVLATKPFNESFLYTIAWLIVAFCLALGCAENDRYPIGSYADRPADVGYCRSFFEVLRDWSPGELVRFCDSMKVYTEYNRHMYVTDLDGWNGTLIVCCKDTVSNAGRNSSGGSFSWPNLESDRD